MPAPTGRTYVVQVDVIAEVYVTILENLSIVIEDPVTADYALVENGKFDVYALSEPPYSAHIAECITRELLSSRHDGCDWTFTPHPSGHHWYRVGACPSCGRR